MDALIVAPVFDDITVYSHEWAQAAVELFPNPPQQIGGEVVTRDEVMNAWTGKDMLAFYNHGSEEVLWGSPENRVVDLDNVAESPPVIYTMACLSAQKLGVEAWKHGRVFWGYSQPFSFSTTALDEFKEFANNGLKLVLQEGKSWGDALVETRTLGESLRKELMSTGRFIAAACIQSDTSCLRCYDGEAPQESGCTYRQTALDILGPRAWWITRTQAVITLCTLIIAVLALLFNYDLVFPWGETVSMKTLGLLYLLVAYLVSIMDFMDLADKTTRLRKYLCEPGEAAYRKT